jgi:hypothetical protein
VKDNRRAPGNLTNLRHFARHYTQAANPSFVSDVGKCSLAVVVVQDILAILSDKEIGETVITKISKYAAQSLARFGHNSPFRYVSKRAVMVIAVKGIHDRNAASAEVSSIDEINILPAIPIEIGDAYSGTKILLR